MANSIPASDIVRINPQVLSAGGAGRDLVGLVLTPNERLPYGEVVTMASAADVASYFGQSSRNATYARDYFAGFTGSAVKPGALRFYRWAVDPIEAFLRGGDVSYLTVPELQALPGDMSLTIDGTLVDLTGLSFAGANSFSDVAQLIQDAIDITGAEFTADINGVVMTVTAVTSGTLAVGQKVVGPDVEPNTYIVDVGTAAGGVGAYTVSTAQTVASGALASGVVEVTYDTVSSGFLITTGTPGANASITFADGPLAVALALEEGLGAIISQGSDAVGADQVMADVVDLTQNFASFSTSFVPTTAQALALAEWNNAQDNRFMFAMLDTQIAATTDNPATAPGYQIAQADYSGTSLVYAPQDRNQTALVLAYAASLDFTQTAGATTAAFRRRTGLSPDVTNQSVSRRLEANGYNYIGAWADQRDGRFTFFNPGQVTGPFRWMDSYVEQIWMNSGLQSAMMNLLLSARKIPYNDYGRSLIEAAMMDVVNAALNYGSIQPGITLSEVQRAQINAEAGGNVADTVEERGWYIHIGDPGPIARSERTSPPISLWYTSGGSVQRININSIEVQ